MTSHDAQEKKFSAAQIAKMFKVESTKQTMLNAEEKGVIPKAERIQRGKTSYRAWALEQLPEIGGSMGFLNLPIDPSVIAIFSLKGGTGKTSFAFQFARTMALHNKKVLVIGLDAQESITQTIKKALKRGTPQDLTTLDDTNGLYQYLADGAPLETLVHPTDLPTLFFIPETIELSILGNWLNQQKRKEYILRERVIAPLLRKYEFDIVLFDCNPAWNDVVTAALAASDTLISPLGADINSLKAANIFTDLLADFQDDMKHSFETFFIVPTMVEPNKLSQSIQARYRLDYDKLCTVNSVRRSIVVQEANAVGRSLLETAYDSPVYDDFVGVFKEIADAMATTRAQDQAPVRADKITMAEL